ncbi:MAG: HDOD domain-containing protein [Zoogloea sp.]|uniref:EAL and HDOD domain-containing protein n=1 Tax=Zoogloea sp. TaxID=49181 RepID=UPI0026180684|nr:HDOD domain-containing protein [Zoogloea sp.]MDD3328770.1 HDOD domain-containing protein [Zoogloea sp.]
MSNAVLITREPVINKQYKITANRLIVHAATVAQAVEGLQGLADVWPATHPVFISLYRLVPTPDLLEWTAPPNAMVEIPTQAIAHPLTLSLIPRLQEAGISLNLTWYQPDTVVPPNVPWRFVIIDAKRQPLPAAPPGLAIAWGLADVPDFRDAIAQGYDGASGWFFLRGVKTDGKLAPSHAQIVRLLNLVRRNAEVKDIENVLKQDVALSYKLLRYINSAGFGLMCEIQSFRHAVTILGYEKLHKWLSVLLISASRDPSAPALMQTAIARGRFMEKIGSAFFEKGELDNLFITGAFSMLHLLLGASLQSALEEMHLPPPIYDALVGGDGVYAPFLKLARALESFDEKQLAALAHDLHITPDEVNRAHLEALAFADSLQFG